MNTFMNVIVQCSAIELIRATTRKIYLPSLTLAIVADLFEEVLMVSPSLKGSEFGLSSSGLKIS